MCSPACCPVDFGFRLCVSRLVIALLNTGKRRRSSPSSMSLTRRRRRPRSRCAAGAGVELVGLDGLVRRRRGGGLECARSPPRPDAVSLVLGMPRPATYAAIRGAEAEA
ncbi:hypothetical protein SEVIR_2G323433v4 [Setaria viridis]